MTDTPRMDNAITTARGANRVWRILVEARSIERELAAAKAELTMWRGGELNSGTHRETADKLKAVTAELAAVTAQRDALMRECQEYSAGECLHFENDKLGYGHTECDPQNCPVIRNSMKRIGLKVLRTLAVSVGQCRERTE